MKSLVKLGLVIVGLAGLTGCATHQVVPTPGNITLQEALKSVGDGLRQLKESGGGLHTGLLPSSLTVTFNVTASSSGTNGLFVTASVPVSGATVGAGGGAGASETASRGNTITLTFTNILLLTDTNAMVYARPAKSIVDMITTLANGNVLTAHKPAETNQAPK